MCSLPLQKDAWIDPLNISKRQHLNSSFCPLSSVSLSTSLFMSLSPSSRRHTPPSAITSLSPCNPLVTNKYTHTQWHEWINMLSFVSALGRLSWMYSPPLLSIPPNLLLSPYRCCCLFLPLHHSDGLAACVLIRLLKVDTHCRQQIYQVANATKSLIKLKLNQSVTYLLCLAGLFPCKNLENVLVFAC